MASVRDPVLVVGAGRTGMTGMTAALEFSVANALIFSVDVSAVESRFDVYPLNHT